MLNDKAQVMMLLKEAARSDRLAEALDVVTAHSRGAGVPDWQRIRAAIAMLLRIPEAPAAHPSAVMLARGRN